MPAFYLPANDWVVAFDFAMQFDLTDGRLKIDLSPSTIQDASGITSVSLVITRPDRTITDAGAVFTPANINDTYMYVLPKVQGTYMWGMYTVKATLLLQGVSYPVEKQFNLCAPDSKDAYANDATGTIQLQVDCAMGTLTARGFCGYAYKGIPPDTETWSLTRYYPPEAELLPQKGLTTLPFVVDAYIGINKVKGVNISTYDFGDSISVTLRIVASAEKNIRCGIDMAEVYCGMKALLDQMAACNATAQDYTVGFGEINALLWTVTVGLNENKDVDDYIVRLEKLLGVDCNCQACAGEKVGPTCVPICPQVENATAVVVPNAAGDHLQVNYDTSNLPAGSSVHIQYRPFCDPAANAPFVDAGLKAIQGKAEQYSIAIPEDLTQQVMLSVVMADGSECPPLTLWAQGNCPQVKTYNKPPDKPLTIVVDWGWSDNPFTAAIAQAFTYQKTAEITPGGDIIADYANAPENTSYLVLRYPIDEPEKKTWFNTSFNNGSIPDQIFTKYDDTDYHYVWSRVQPSLQDINKKIIFK